MPAQSLAQFHVLRQNDHLRQSESPQTVGNIIGNGLVMLIGAGVPGRNDDRILSLAITAEDDSDPQSLT